MPRSDALAVSDAVRESFQPVLQALPLIRDALAGRPDIVNIRPGYQYPDGGEPVPSAVVAVVPDTMPVSAQELQEQFGVPVSVTDATVEEQLAQIDAAPVAFETAGGATVSPLEAMLRDEAVIAFAPPKRGTYEPMDPPNLPLVEEKMGLTVCVSPEAGWSELEAFLGGTRKRLTVAMYQFTAPHVFKAIEEAVTPGHRTFELVLHPFVEPPTKGVKEHDLKTKIEILKPLDVEMRNRFEHTWATFKTAKRPDGLWASAYHIKVAVRDGKVGWLSSGNWQSTNQPDVHLFGDGADPGQPLPDGFPGEYNREYHAIFESKTLAAIFEEYIKRDFELCASQAGEPVEFAAPDVFVPEAVEIPEAFGEGGQFFPPLRVDRVVKVQPLLTPDNYAENVLKLIKSAKKSLRFQNQYINLRGDGEDFPELLALVEALKEKALDPDVEVRLIFRNLMTEDKLDLLTAQGFPRKTIRFQEGCHNKTIIVDDKVAMVGSHNWSSEGVAANRDASLIFFDGEIAEYLAGVFDDDWEFRANDKPARTTPRVARPGEPTPPGFTRVPLSVVFDDD
jgi:PLD-like domain